MMRRSRKRCQKDDIRKIRYKKQIDFTGSNEYFTPITKPKTMLSSQSIYTIDKRENEKQL